MQSKRCSHIVLLLSALCLLLTLSSCYHQKQSNTHDAFEYNERQLDSISFSSSHHYTKNYNFVVKTDSITLVQQQPEEVASNLPIDTLKVYKHDHLVVADIRMLPTDDIDSVWVQVARDQSTIGWIHETDLLPNVVPDDPISQFISIFSDTHLLIFLIVISFIAAGYLARTFTRRKARIVHFNDIDSVYPTLLAVVVAASATFYASIQTFAPEVWRHFYYHPTLNPFSVPTLLSIFLISVWSIIIIAFAAVDDALHLLCKADALLYLCGLGAVCAVNYIVFSISTLYYIGYILLALYIYYAFDRYYNCSMSKYVCGNCGAKLVHKGRCPHCGALNI